MDDDLEGIELNIRACIRSSTVPIPLRNLSRDYETLVGDQIPFRQFNFASLEDFLRSLPSLRVQGSGGQAVVEATSSSASNHVTALISKQKSTSKKFAPPPRRSYPSSSFRGRGGTRGRGRGSYPSRPYAPRNYSTREPLPRDYNGHHSRDYPSRDQSARDYNDRDYPSRDQSARNYNDRDYPSRDQSGRDYNDHHSREYPSRDYDDHHSREYPSRDQSSRDYPVRNQSRDYAGGDQPSRDYNHTNSAPKRYSPNFHNRTDTAQPGGPITVRVVGEDKRQVTWKTELPPRLQKLKNQNPFSQQHSDITPAPSVSSESQMVLEIHCLGSSLANDLVAYLQTDESFSSHLKVSRFFYLPGATIKEVELLLTKDKPDLNRKVPLLVMLGENDILLTTEKTKEIKKDYISLIFFLRQLCPGIQLILVHLPSCFCSYKNQNYFERTKSFNEFLSNGLQNHANEIFVLNLHKVLDKFEFFNCQNNKTKPLFEVSCHVNERGFSALVRSLITQLQQGFDMSLFLNPSTSVSNSASIISPLGPSQLIAAGLAKQRAEKAKLEQQYFGTSDFLLQSTSQGTLDNDLAGDFARLSHQDSDGVALGRHRTSLNGHNQILEDASGLPLPHLEGLLPEPDDDNILNNTGILQRYCLSRGWPAPTYSVHHQKCSETRQVLYFASVKVNGGCANTFQVSTLPFEHANADIVKGFAAKKALKKILAEESKKVKADKIISSDSHIICSRISDIVAGATNGLFVKSVEDEYISRHNELLPDDWLQTVRSWPTLSVESTVNSTIIVPRDPPKEQEQPIEPVEPVQYDPTVAPPPLPIEALGDDKDMEDVYITHATSVNNVWFRVIGQDFSDQYEELVKHMDEYYKGLGSQDLALTLEVGQYYAACGLDTWFRVCVTEVDDESQSVVAWLVDHGDNETFAFGSLYRLASQFCQLPRQAVRSALEGLESFNDDELANEVVINSDIMGMSLIAKISNKDIESGSVKVTLYDTSGDDDIVVNEQIKGKIIEKATPALPAEGCATEIAIGDISKKGEVYIMIDNPSLDRIAEILESLGPDKISEHKLTSFKHISLNKMYLAKFSKDDTWYRAVVTTTPSVQHNKIPVRFVDYGNTESVSISDIADLENLPQMLRQLPAQAVKVALHNLPLDSLTNPEVARLHSLLLDEDKVVLIKTISLTAEPPVVEIFTKETENDPLVSVNSTIELQRNLLNYVRNKEKNSSSDFAGTDANCNLATNNQDHFVLKCPDFSNSGFQGILIVLAAHPGNFIFQPVKYAKDLKKLGGQMEAYYNAGALPELTADRVVKNKLFAARYVDDLWYRVVVTDSPMGNRVPVRLCDFGDVTCVSISSLRELALEFHIYPFMAVKGKLAGVVPIHKDWSVEDCIRFQNLVVNQILAGIVVNIQTNEENPMEMLVTLNLVDTSSDQDQDIAEILLREQRAVRES